MLKGRYKRFCCAFTLVELMMVVTLIGLMAVFVVPNYTKAISRSSERTANNNLAIIYAAQNLKKNSGGSYLAGANTAAINTNLSLGIVDPEIDYTCASATGAAFFCKATRKDGSFILGVSDTNATVCCCSASCPLLAACAAACP